MFFTCQSTPPLKVTTTSPLRSRLAATASLRFVVVCIACIISLAVIDACSGDGAVALIVISRPQQAGTAFAGRATGCCCCPPAATAAHVFPPGASARSFMA